MSADVGLRTCYDQTMADDAGGAFETLYDKDVVAWAEQQADALRRRLNGDALDYNNLAEEIEDLAKRERKSCLSYIDVIIEHLLKLEFSAQLREQNQRGWRASVKAARFSLQDDLTPTLRSRLPRELDARYAQRLELLDEAGHLTPDETIAARAARSRYSWTEITSETWWPEPR